MKFAKHLARAMEVSDPEWHPFWVNYKHLKKLLKPAVGNTNTLVPAAASAGAHRPASPHAAGVGSSARGGAAAAGRVTAASGEKAMGATMSLSGNQHHKTSNDETEASLSARGLRRPRPWEPAAAAAAATTDATGRAPLPAVVAGGDDRKKFARVGGEAGAAAAKSGKDEAATPRCAHSDIKLEPAERRPSPLAGASAGVSRKGQGSDPGRTRACGVSGGCCDDVPPPATAAVGCCRAVPSEANGGGPEAFSVSPCAVAAAAAAAANAAAAAAAATTGTSVAGGRTQAGRSGTTLAGGVEGRQGQRLQQQQQLQQPQWLRLPGSQQCKCPFFGALLREVDKCRVFFLENEHELKVRTRRLQLALDHLKRPDLSRLSSVKGAHMKLMQACVNFYRDALLLEDFAMLNYTAVIKLLKKRDKLAGTSDQRPFMSEVMTAQPFAMYPGVAKRVVQVEQIFRDIENMCFLRTGEGFKSVMKAELTVVEAIMQLAQESKAAQHKELDGGTPGNSRPPPDSSATTHEHHPQQQRPQEDQDHNQHHPQQQRQQEDQDHNQHHPQQQRQQEDQDHNQHHPQQQRPQEDQDHNQHHPQQQRQQQDVPSQAKAVRWCESGAGSDTGTKAAAETLSYAGEISAMEAARAWARASCAASGSTASGGGGGGGGGLHGSAVRCQGGGSEGGDGGRSAAALPHQPATAEAKGGTKAVKAGSEWVLSRHAGRGEATTKRWGCYRLGFREREAGAQQAGGRGRGGGESAGGFAQPAGTEEGQSGRRGWEHATASMPLTATTRNPTPTPARHASTMLSVRPHSTGGFAPPAFATRGHTSGCVSVATTAGCGGIGAGSGGSGSGGSRLGAGAPGGAVADLAGRVVLPSAAVVGPRLVTSAGLVGSDGGRASKQARLG